MAKKAKRKPSTIKHVLKKELSKRSKYKTTYKDIKNYFIMINEAVFNNKLSPFNEILIKQIRDRKHPCMGQVLAWSWKRKGTRQYWLEMLPTYHNKKEFVDTLAHEMVHLYQMANLGDTGNHNKLFYSFRPKLNKIGLDL